MPGTQIDRSSNDAMAQVNVSETKAGRIDAMVQVCSSTIQQFSCPISWWFAFLVFMTGCGKSDVIDRIGAGDSITELHLSGFAIGSTCSAATSGQL
jgi:hypothetical protein